jgi:hypothetical protein
MPIGILYEHPEWFELLFSELDRRGLPFSKLPADALLYDPAAPPALDLVVNRMSPSSHRRGHGNGIFLVRDYLRHLEENRVPVVNGSAAYAVEISKAWQLDLFRRCGVGYPRAIVVNHASRVLEAARALTFPIVFKPNVGGSGAGIVRFDSLDQLAAATFDFGVDGTALLQEFLPARGQSIVRVEILDGEFLYAIRIWPDLTSFNLCPADICQVPEEITACPVDTPGKKKLRIEREDPSAEAIAGALALAKAAQLDVGGIEFLVDDRTGRIAYYDINALSNFVTDAVNVVGFDPTARFVDYLERRLQR